MDKHPEVKGLRPPEHTAGHSIRTAKTPPSQSSKTDSVKKLEAQTLNYKYRDTDWALILIIIKIVIVIIIIVFNSNQDTTTASYYYYYYYYYYY